MEKTFKIFFFFRKKLYLKSIIPDTCYFATYHIIEADVQGCSVKTVFFKISKNSQENNCVRVSFLIKQQDSGVRHATLLKKRLWRTCEFCEIFQNTFSYRTLPVAASYMIDSSYKWSLLAQNFFIILTTFFVVF